MNSPALDIANYLETSGVMSDLSLGTNLFISVLPDKTGNIAVGIFDGPGAATEPNDIWNPTIQLLVRGLPGGYASAYEKIRYILYDLHSLSNITLGGTLYIVVWALTDVMHVGNDSAGRPMFSCSLRIKRT